MRIGIPSFQPDRLIEARDSRGLSQVALGEMINRTSASISRWESGNQFPEIDALDDLSKALNLPVAFFLKPLPDHGQAPMFFRSMASITKAGRKRAKVRLRWAQDISLSLQESVDLPDVKVPKLPADSHLKISNEDIEAMANECRKIWGLGVGPISDVLLVLENAGIVVVSEEVGTVSMDGLSNWSSADNRPYIFLAKDKASCVRSRLDAAHELGHLVLHHNLNEKALSSAADFKEIERQAFHFAGAFLMPAESFGAEIWSPSLSTFVSLKERWKTAIGAMIKRCSNLGIIDEGYERQIWKYYSAKGWRKNEPLDDVLEQEKPRLLSRSIKLLVEEKVKTRAEILEDVRLNYRDVESLSCLPNDFMKNEETEIVHFPRIKGREIPADKGDNNGTIIPFNKK